MLSGRGLVGAAESVCAAMLWVRAASASERELGVRPEGVAGGKAVRLGSWRLSWSPIVCSVVSFG